MRNCEKCPENRGFDSWPGYRLPCGQFKCWCEIYEEMEQESNEESWDPDYSEEE